MRQTNQTQVTEFFLLGLSDDQHTQQLLFTLFLGVYLVTVLGNLLLMFLIQVDSQLHTPMYFFLANLSFLEILYTSSVVPKMLEGFLQEAAISVAGCLLQFFIFGSLATAECFLLAVMAYDRYLAICYPLRYPLLMGPRCVWGWWS